MTAPLSREREWDELVRINQALQRKYTVARDENDLVIAKLYKKRWNRQQDRMRTFLARQRQPATHPLG
ncbi:MAG: hypothetical protein KF889_17940 [Alphaproteobacteria bacterium]|nr:hypothetical protein [Alphaproteobacteria bacterium]MCW5741335.1 hypothetical protein [Alphaproteobacteria bacterium]